MGELIVFLLFVVGAFLLGIWYGRLLIKMKPEESGFYIIDDRDFEKTKITIDLHEEPEDIAGKRFVTFRVLKKT